jgi:hypothetical protein
VDIKKINSEISSKALKEIASQLDEAIVKAKTKTWDLRTSAVVIAGCKHMVQTMALDWTFRNKNTAVLEEA